MVLLHGGGPGAEKIAASWAEKNGVHQVVCKPNWDRDGKAAPFRRNDVLLNFLPKGLLAFPGSGITNNLVDKARKIRNSRTSRRRVAIPFRAGPRHHSARDRSLFFCRFAKDEVHGGALRATANRASLRSQAARRSSNDASPPHGTALRAIAVGGR